jgi:hypothetical protein
VAVNVKPGNLRRISQFQQDGSDQQRQLSQLEGNVTDAIAEVVVNVAFRLRPTSVKTANYQAQLNDLVICDGTFGVLLPTASKMNAGRAVAVLRKSGTVTVSCATSQVQGAASDALATTGLRVYISDGVGGWWRAP